MPTRHGAPTTHRPPAARTTPNDDASARNHPQTRRHFRATPAKLPCRGPDFPAAVTRANRALAEFRIRGVSTNTPFLPGELDAADSHASDLHPSFIYERPTPGRIHLPPAGATRMLHRPPALHSPAPEPASTPHRRLDQH
ncbi:hypothetical protein, partial [Clavibacter michiganensis]|uniref:hypothetical protein n=1 Tax=Clavibacter michiganensis TaxID=28447 RepID=UPI0029319FD4